MKDKIKVDAIRGCKIRAIIYEKNEVAIVIDNKHWGLGQEIMNWAKAMGHNELFIHRIHNNGE